MQLPTLLLPLLLLIGAAVAAAAPGGTCGWPFERVGTLPTRASTAIAASNISVGAECMDRNFSNFGSWRAYLAPLGAKHARLQSGWGKTEQQPGVYDFAWLDEVVDGMLAVGVTPWLQLSYGNPVYGAAGGTTSASSPLPTGAAAGAAWLSYVRATVARYRSKISEYEIWNEPDLYIPQADYEVFLVQTARAVLSAYPGARIYQQIATNMDYALNTTRYVAANAPHDVLPVLSVTYHPYSYNPDAVYGSLVRQLVDGLHGIAPSVTVRQGENGAPSVGGGYGALTDYNWTETSQAKWMARRVLGDLGDCAQQAGGIPTSVFSIADICYAGKVNHKGLLEVNCSDPAMPVLRAKLAYQTLQYITALFDAALVPDCAGSSNVTVAGGNRSRALRWRSAAGQAVVAFWDDSGTPADAVLPPSAPQAAGCVQVA